jgi:hypothetical protein
VYGVNERNACVTRIGTGLGKSAPSRLVVSTKPLQASHVGKLGLSKLVFQMKDYGRNSYISPHRSVTFRVVVHLATLPRFFWASQNT